MTSTSLQTDEQRLDVRSRFATSKVNPRDVILFPDGLPGYETTKEFVLLDVPEQAPLKVLHAVNGSDTCFLVVDPKAVLPTYRCERRCA